MKREIRQKDLRIKFDKRDLKIYMWLWLVVSVITFIGAVPLVWYAKPMKELTYSQTKVLETAVLIMPVIAVLWVGLAFKLLEGVCYLKRLKRYGYLVPDSKKTYENNLENLIQDEETCKEQGIRKSKTGIALTVIAVIAVFLMTYINLTATRVPHVWGILVCVLLAVLYARQISGRKFRDDVDIYGNPERKVRRNLDDGLLEISLVFIVILVFFVLVPDAFPGKVNPLFYRQAVRYEKRDSDNYGIYDFFPDRLPKETEDVLIRMTYSELALSFYTSERQIEEYMEIYNQREDLTAYYSSEDTEDFMKYAELSGERYLAIPEKMGSGDRCYLYRFERGFVFINRETGYVGMYCGTMLQAWD